MNSLDFNDLPFLKEESLRVFHWLLNEFPKIEIPNSPTLNEKDNQSNEPIEFPIRWTIEQFGQRFEWVVSDMGSVTLRLGGLEGNRRNPAPIFYLSLRKSKEGKFHWTDPEGNPVPFPDSSILVEIQNRVHLYIDSVS
ncbi:LIC_13241 domain-containing protein [Leptospira harrisiae]|uniref:Uncharacterized protein n=1 Tax=Leptospira harrisiae TaxID=2023189 RepID=A0A2N0ALJ4_9LEPT|nr:hypothetical protein [Leptospira harrisiae]PJZ85091.1 hypothetical protein CH364_02140 [Leptospira harrisiae]PKA08596.1 hypothetical protein CH366_02140 [Leptospira harrisiae]